MAADLGVTIVPQSVAERAGLPFAEIDQADFTRTIYLAGRQPEPAARALLAHLIERGPGGEASPG